MLTDFLQSQYDLSLIFRKTSHGITILLVYIDDIIITGDDPNIILQLQKSLHASFHMKDLGPLTNFLGLKVHKTQGRLFMDQNKYTWDLIIHTWLLNTTLVDTPLELNVKYMEDDGNPLLDPKVYRKPL